MVKACKYLTQIPYHVRCFCHVINLIVRQGLSEFGTLIPTIRRNAVSIKGSPLLLSQLEKICLANKLPFKTVVIDQATRWNSTYNMLCRMLYLQIPLQQLEVTSDKLTHITISEWTAASSIINMLDILYQFTLEFQGSSKPNIGSLHLAYRQLDTHLRTFQSENEIVQRSCKVMLEKLQTYYKRQDQFSIVACILDPRVKLLPFSFIERDEVLEIFKRFGKKYITNESSTVIEDKLDHLKKASIIGGLHKRANVMYKNNCEVSRYLSLPTEGGKTNPIKWWNGNQSLFSNLSRMAGDSFGMMPSSAASERLFSKAGRAITNVRNKLKEDSAESTILLHCWTS